MLHLRKPTVIDVPRMHHLMQPHILKEALLPRSERNIVERLRDCRDWSDQAWVRVRHRALVTRLGRWATLRRWPNRADAVVAQLRQVQVPVGRVAGLGGRAADLVGGLDQLERVEPFAAVAALDRRGLDLLATKRAGLHGC